MNTTRDTIHNSHTCLHVGFGLTIYYDILKQAFYAYRHLDQLALKDLGKILTQH